MSDAERDAIYDAERAARLAERAARLAERYARLDKRYAILDAEMAARLAAEEAIFAALTPQAHADAVDAYKALRETQNNAYLARRAEAEREAALLAEQWA
jgi:hypothetical protein